MKDYKKQLRELETAAIMLTELLGLESIPIKVEDLGEEDGRFYLEGPYIAISDKLIDDKLERLKTLIHEYRHYYQVAVVETNDTSEPLLNEFRDELVNGPKSTDPAELMCQYIEIDAYAYTKYILKRVYKIEYHHYDPLYDELLDKFIFYYYIK